MKTRFFSDKGALLVESALNDSLTIPPAVLRRAGRTFTAKMSVPIRDIAGYFHPGMTDGPVSRLDWSISFDGHSSRNFPALCFFSQAGGNRFTIYFDDLADDFTCAARMNQAKNNILASLVVAQACVETGFGANIYRNNLFGIRAGSGYRRPADRNRGL